MSTAKVNVTQVIRHLMSQRLLPKESEHEMWCVSKGEKELDSGRQREDDVFCAKIIQDVTSVGMST